MTKRNSFWVLVLVAGIFFLAGCSNPAGPTPNPTPTPSATPTFLPDPIVGDMRLREGVRVEDVTALTTPGGPSFPAQTVYRPLASCVEFSLGPGVPPVPAEVVDGLGEVGYSVAGPGSGCWVTTVSLMAPGNNIGNGATSPHFSGGVSIRGEIELHPVYGLNTPETWLHELGHALWNLGHVSAQVDAFRSDSSGGVFLMNGGGSLSAHFNQTEKDVIAYYRATPPGQKFRIVQ